MATLIEELVELSRLFGGVGTSDPISGLLLALGTIITLVTVGVGAYLALGAFVDLFIPETTGGAPEREAR